MCLNTRVTYMYLIHVLIYGHRNAHVSKYTTKYDTGILTYSSFLPCDY